MFYKKENELADKFANGFGAFYTWAYHKFYFDELYLFVTKRILFNGIAKTAARFDKKYVDGTMVGIGNQTLNTSEKIKGIQSGKVQDYAFAFIAGAVVLAIICIYLWMN